MRTPGTNDRGQEEAETQATFHAPLDHEQNKANRAMQLIPMPSALLSRFLLAQEVAPEASGDT
jgi:hypothetical protein